MCDHEWVKIVDNTTVTGGHLHVYECKICSLVSYNDEIRQVEEITYENKD